MSTIFSFIRVIAELEFYKCYASFSALKATYDVTIFKAVSMFTRLLFNSFRIKSTFEFNRIQIVRLIRIVSSIRSLNSFVLIRTFRKRSESVVLSRWLFNVIIEFLNLSFFN